MKSNRLKQTGKAIVFLIVALTMTASSAQQLENTPPSANSSAPKAPSKLSAIQNLDSWVWPGSNEKKFEILYDRIPLSEVVKDVREMFKHQFDLLLPRNLVIPNLNTDVQAVAVNLHLRNVTAAELFNAMSLYFEIQKVPLRWKLTMNGQRPTAALEIVEEPKRPETPASEKPQKLERGVIFVGDLLGDSASGGMTMDKLAKTLLETYGVGYGPPSNGRTLVQCHYGAELIIVTGTSEEISFIHSTVDALKQKVVNDRDHKAGQTATQSNPKSSLEKKNP